VLEGGHQRRGLAVVPDQAQDADPLIGLGKAAEHRARAVARAVVDKDDLVGSRQAVERLGQRREQRRQRLDLVVDRDDDRYVHWPCGARNGLRQFDPHILKKALPGAWL
jgi:hypothetical protein